MAEKPTTVLGDMFRPWWVRWLGIGLAALASYDTLSSQLELPTVRKLLGMSGALLPWWGWLLILQAVFVIALFEFVRRNVSSGAGQGDANSGDLARLTHNHANLRDKFIEAEKDIQDTGKTAKEAAEAVENFTIKIDKLEISVKKQTVEFERVAGEIETIRGAAVGLPALDGLHEKVDKLSAAIAPLDEGVELVRRDLGALRERVSQSFAALLLREILADIERQLSDAARDLFSRLNEGHIYDEETWSSWESVHAHWRGLIEQWLGSAKWYAPRVKSRVLTVADSNYGGSWPVKDNQFPNSEAVRRYKQHRIIQQQWAEVRVEVESGIKRVAFHGATEAEVRDGLPPE